MFKRACRYTTFSVKSFVPHFIAGIDGNIKDYAVLGRLSEIEEQFRSPYALLALYLCPGI